MTGRMAMAPWDFIIDIKKGALEPCPERHCSMQCSILEKNRLSMTNLKKRTEVKIGTPVKRHKKKEVKIVKMSGIKRKTPGIPGGAKFKFDRKHRKSRKISVENLKICQEFSVTSGKK